MTATVTDNVDRGRYEVAVDGEVAGYAEYLHRGGQLLFTHTEIAHEFGGQGLASTLIGAALDDARVKGLAVLPLCPFVRAFIEKHDDYLDLVPAAERSRFGLAAAP